VKPDRSNLRSLEEFKHLVSSAANRSLVIALDIETTGLTLFEDQITWISWCTSENCFGAVAVAHKNPITPSSVMEDVRSLIREIHQRKGKTIIWHNGSFDLAMLVAAGWLSLDDLDEQTLFDTMLASYVLNPVKKNEGSDHRLKTLYREYCKESESDPDQPEFDDVTHGMDFREVEYEEAEWYAAFDAWTAYVLYGKFKELLANEKLDHYFFKIEMPHLLTTVEIRTTGFLLVGQNKVDGKEQRRLLELKREYESVKDTVFSLLDTTFNFESPESMRKALFSGPYGIRPQGRKKATGRYHLDKATLVRILCEEKMSLENCKVIAYILYAKQLAAAIAKHEEMYGYVHRGTNRIYPNISPLTSSGRYFASRPNTLSLNSASKIKHHIVPASQNAFVIGDFSQIDLRVIANETATKMLTDVNSGIDLHLNTLKIVYPKKVGGTWKSFYKKEVDIEGGKKEEKLVGVWHIKRPDPEEFHDEKRLAELKQIKKIRHNIAKPINFGVSYGLGVRKLHENLNSTDEFREQILILPKNNQDLSASERDVADAQWIEKIREILSVEPISLEQVESYLESFHATYPDIAKFQDAVLNDLLSKGGTSNIFGRTCRAELIPYLNDNAVFDVRVLGDYWYRVWAKRISLNDESLTCEIRHVVRLEDATPGSRSARKQLQVSEMEFKEAAEVYSVDSNQLAEVWSRYHQGKDVDELIDGLLLIQEDADLGALPFLQAITAIPPLDSNGEQVQNVDRPLLPYAEIPHNIIMRIQAGDRALYGERPFVAFPGFDKIRRKLISQRVSSTSMDFCKIAMIEFRRWAKQYWPDQERRPKIINCIHDEIAVECHESERASIKEKLHAIMRDQVMFREYLAPDRTLKVELDADVKADFNYAEAKP
jgi:DNA polymerase I-like protein with 3'-5' exonuclease and polymerase domains